MTSNTATDGTDLAAPAARGRPRDDARTEAILEAAHDVLHRDGWDGFKMDAVAKEAGCGLATIYRRWDTKEEVAAAAIQHRFLPVFEEIGDARADMRSLTVALAEDVIAMGGHCLGLLAATQTDPLMQAAMAEGLLNVARPKFGGYLDELFGENSPHKDLIIDGAAGALIIRIALLGSDQSAQDFADEVMRMIDALLSS